MPPTFTYFWSIGRVSTEADMSSVWGLENDDETCVLQEQITMGSGIVANRSKERSSPKESESCTDAPVSSGSSGSTAWTPHSLKHHFHLTEAIKIGMDDHIGTDMSVKPSVSSCTEEGRKPNTWNPRLLQKHFDPIESTHGILPSKKCKTRK